MPQMYSRQEPEKEMRNTILISLLLMLLPVSVSAQFYTITRDSALLPTERQKESYNRAGKDVTEGKKNKMMVKDTLTVGSDNQKKLDDNSRNSDRKASLKTELQKKTDYGEFYQFNLSSCIRQQNSLTAQFVSFSLSNLANIFYPSQFLQ